MSYTNIITGGSSVNRVGNPSFDDELADLQDQIDGIGGGSVPTGTGLRHVTSGVEDGTAYTLSAADISIMSPETTTGDYQHYVLTDSRITITDGVVFSARIHTTSGPFCRLAVNGGTERDIMPATAGLLVGGRSYLFTYDASQGYYYVISKLALTPGDMPAIRYLQALLSSQTPGSGGVALAYQAASVNTTGLSYSASAFTATEAGWYTVQAAATSNTSRTNSYLEIAVNGSPVRYSDYKDISAALKINEKVYLGIGDALSIKLWMSGSALLYSTGPWALLLIFLEGE